MNKKFKIIIEDSYLKAYDENNVSVGYQPKNNAPELDGLPLLPEIVVEDDVEKLAEINVKKVMGHLFDKSDLNTLSRIEMFKRGYKVATKIYSEEDLRKAFNYGTNEGYNYRDLESIDEKPEQLSEEEWNSFVKNLKQFKTPKWFAAEMKNEIALDGHTVIGQELKTTTINGKTYLAGTYLYE